LTTMMNCVCKSNSLHTGNLWGETGAR
jgi:hypothetical protein